MPTPKGGPSPWKSEKIWREAIHRAVKRSAAGHKTKRLEQLADQLVKEGMNGNIAALKEIGDRLDGKAIQPVAGDGDSPPISVIHRVVIGPKD